MIQQKMCLYLILGMMVLIATTSQAATTWPVSSSADDGVSTSDPLTLRGALSRANDGDTIYFNALSSSITAMASFHVSNRVCIQGNGTTIGALGSSPGSNDVLTIYSAGNTITGLAIVSGFIGIDLLTGNGCSIVQNCRIGIDWKDIVRGNNLGIAITTSHNLIGGYNADASHFVGNVISGNTNGIYVDVGGMGNSICGNLIGLNANGTLAIPNTSSGIHLAGPNNLIGSNTPGWRNAISGTYVGINISSPGNVVVGNYLGLSWDGMSVISNNTSISITSANGCRIGGTGNGEGNFIAGTAGGINVGYGASGNTIVGNYLGVLADQTVASQHLTSGIILDNNAVHNRIGLESAGQGNLIAGTTNDGIYADGTTQNNSWYANTICAFSNQGIILSSGANNNKAAPSITSAAFPLVIGTSGTNDKIQVFLSDRGTGVAGGSLKLLGTATAVGIGWTCTLAGPPFSGYICAIATDTQDNSSAFSANYFMTIPTPTFTITKTSTITPTPTVTPTFTPSLTPTRTSTITPTPTVTRTITPTYTISPTFTISPTSTITPTITPTSTISPTWDFHFNSEGVRVYPNPGKTKIRFAFQVSQASTLKVAVFNLAGEKAAELTNDSNHELVWDCQSAAPGVYLARISVNGKVVKTEKIAVIH